MVQLSEIKLLPHLPSKHLAGSSGNARKIGKSKADAVIHLSLLEERTARYRTAVYSNLREVHTHQGNRSIYRHVEIPVGALIDIYA